MRAHLSKDLMKRYKRRSITVRRGDMVKIMRGQFRDKEGKVEEVVRGKLYIDCAKMKKADGSEVRYPIHPSNVLVVKADMSDPKRKGEVKKDAS
jgi:large subunit ribosomal protein L24